MANKRIIDLTEIQNIAEDDYVILDSNTDGTRKILASNIGGSSGGGINYSTEEQDTGLKWVDGRTIYQKTFAFVNTGAAFKQDFRFTTSSLIGCMLIKGWNTWYQPSNNYVVTNTAVQYGLSNDTGEVHMMYGPQVAFSLKDGASGYITLQYIKLSETPNS